MAVLKLSDVQGIAQRGRPWTTRLELVDPSTNTRKFWFATGRGHTEAVETGWGRIGAPPQLALVSFPKFVARLNEKLAKGYRYSRTGHVRMSPGNLALVTQPSPKSSGQTPVQVLKPTKTGFDGLDVFNLQVQSYTFDEGRDLILSGVPVVGL